VITLPAPAKVNLALEVLGQREDGYHELRSVVQTITLVDLLSFAPSAELRFFCDVPALATPRNLVVRAAELLRQRAGVRQGAIIRLRKRIPPAAGLGGGSSDAAATFVGLARLWGLDDRPEALAPLAAELGADVSFFLWGGTAQVAGRGEQVLPLPAAPPLWFVLIAGSAPVADKTRRVFAALQPEEWSGGERVARLATALATGTFDPAACFNALTAPALRVFPALASTLVQVQAVGATPLVAGAGPSVFAVSREGQEARRWQRALRQRGLPARIVRTLSSAR